MAGIKSFRSLLLALTVSLLLVSCGRAAPKGLRIGFLTNLTHAVPIVGAARGDFESAAGRPVRMVPFNAGPAAVEALLAGEVDMVYCGPGPAINVFVRSGGKVRVLAGAASGGAQLIVRAGVPIEDPSDLAGKRLATPQIGNSQDIALRKYLWDNDLAATDAGGKVTVVPMTNSDILQMFKQGEIDGAWVPEPWATRLVQEAGGRVYLDEASLWPDGRFPTTILVTTGAALQRDPEEIGRIVRANHTIVSWINSHPVEARVLVNQGLERLTGKKLPEKTIVPAWSHLFFTDDPQLLALREDARAAKRVGYLPRSDIRGILVTHAELGLPAEIPHPAAPSPQPRGKR